MAYNADSEPFWANNADLIVHKFIQIHCKYIKMIQYSYLNEFVTETFSVIGISILAK